MAARTSASPIRRALTHREFRRLFAASTISRWGDTFSLVALVIVVFRLTGSGLKVAGTVAFEIVPVLLFGFVAGAVVDRLSRRSVMVTADLGRAAVAVGLAVFHDELWVVYLAALALSSMTVFFNPAAASVIPAVVPEDDLVGANSATWSAAVLSQIALAPAAGALVAAVGAGPAFGVNALSFLVSGALIAGLRLPGPERPAAGRHLDDVAEGLRLIRRDRFLFVLAIVQVLAALSAGATSALLVVLAADHLGVGPGRFGLLLGAIGVGAGLGPLVLQRFLGDVRRRGWLFGPYLLRGVVDVVLAAVARFGVAVGALALYGVGTSTGMVTYNTVLQERVGDEFRGRVFAFYDVVWQGARLLSLAAGGVLADTLGVRWVYVFGGGLLILAGAVGLVASPSLSEPDTSRSG